MVTQNPHQGYPPGYPPQGYPQQPPAQGPPPGQYPPAPQGPPPGYPPQQPEYPQPNQQGQYPPPGAPAGPPPPPAAAPGDRGFGDPDTRPAAGDQPAIHQLTASNRLVLVHPLRWNVGGKKFNSEEPEEQMVVDIIVCDGPPIAGHVDFNTKVEAPFATGPKVAPFFIGEAIVNKAILDRCRAALTDPTAPDWVIGRMVTKPPAGGKGFPWNNLEQATDADKALAGPIYAARDQIKAQAAALAATAPAQQQAPAGPPPQGPPPTYGQAPQQPQYGPPPGYGQQQQQYQAPPPPPGYGPPPGYQGPPPGPDPYAQPGQAPYPPY